MTADPRAVEIIREALEDSSSQDDEGAMWLLDREYPDAAARIARWLVDAGWSLLPPGGPQDLFVVIKSVPGREPEIMADIAADPGELNGWLAALRYDPDDRLATYTGYRLAPADTPGEPA